MGRVFVAGSINMDVWQNRLSITVVFTGEF
jgi:hypothetical protein